MGEERQRMDLVQTENNQQLDFAHFCTVTGLFFSNNLHEIFTYSEVSYKVRNIFVFMIVFSLSFI